MKKNGKSNGSNDEVEQLLQAAQDEMLMKLSVDSHIASISSTYLNADLDRRFQALKSRPSVPQSQSKSPSTTSSQSQSHRRVSVDDGEFKSIIGDDLSARFAALKASSSSIDTSNNGLVDGPKILDVNDDDDGEDGVEKIIRWAKDAARLDPSPPSDDDGDNDDGDDDDADDRDSDHDTDSFSDDDDNPKPNRDRRQ